MHIGNLSFPHVPIGDWLLTIGVGHCSIAVEGPIGTLFTCWAHWGLIHWIRYTCLLNVGAYDSLARVLFVELPYVVSLPSGSLPTLALWAVRSFTTLPSTPGLTHVPRLCVRVAKEDASFVSATEHPLLIIPLALVGSSMTYDVCTNILPDSSTTSRDEFTSSEARDVCLEEDQESPSAVRTTA